MIARAIVFLIVIAAILMAAERLYSFGDAGGYNRSQMEFAAATKAKNDELDKLKGELEAARTAEAEMQKTVLATITANMGTGELSKGQCRVIPEPQRERFNKVK